MMMMDVGTYAVVALWCLLMMNKYHRKLLQGKYVETDNMYNCLFIAVSIFDFGSYSSRTKQHQNTILSIQSEKVCSIHPI